MGSYINLDFRKLKGVIAKKRIVEIDGTVFELQEGMNQIPVSAGPHQLVAYFRAPIGNKAGLTRPLMVNLAEGQALDVYYTLVGGVLNRQFRLEILGQEAPPPPALPWWAWIFVALCVALPIVALGGAIPAMLGFGGAGGCLGVAKSERLSVVARVLICVAIVVAVWGVFIAIAVAVLSGRGQLR
jgi:hypothetical protein